MKTFAHVSNLKKSFLIKNDFIIVTNSVPRRFVVEGFFKYCFADEDLNTDKKISFSYKIMFS